MDAENSGAHSVEIVDFHQIKKLFIANILLKEIHPGKILLEKSMRLVRIIARQLSSDMDAQPSDIVNGARPISAEATICLGLFLSLETRFWPSLQAMYDERLAKRYLPEKITPGVRVFQQASLDAWRFLATS